MDRAERERETVHGPNSQRGHLGVNTGHRRRTAADDRSSTSTGWPVADASMPGPSPRVLCRSSASPAWSPVKYTGSSVSGDVASISPAPLTVSASTHSPHACCGDSAVFSRIARSATAAQIPAARSLSIAARGHSSSSMMCTAASSAEAAPPLMPTSSATRSASQSSPKPRSGATSRPARLRPTSRRRGNSVSRSAASERCRSSSSNSVLIRAAGSASSNSPRL